jgi:hypothetical protein
VIVDAIKVFGKPVLASGTAQERGRVYRPEYGQEHLLRQHEVGVMLALGWAFRCRSCAVAAPPAREGAFPDGGGPTGSASGDRVRVQSEPAIRDRRQAGHDGRPPSVAKRF